LKARALTSELTLPTAPTDSMLAVVRAVVFFAVTICAIFYSAFCLLFRLPIGASRQIYFRIIARVLGLRVIARGQPSTKRPMLYVCNHISYLDIVAVGAVVKGEFVARGDMADWPFFGWMAKAGRTVFIDRRRSAAGQAKDAVQQRMQEGNALIMFPESTSGNGNHLLPFKSALFAVAEREVNGESVCVQPMSIAYTRVNNLPMGVGWRSFLAWYGDMTLGPHLWQFLKLGTVTVEIVFHKPVTVAQLGGRKALSAHCERMSAAGFAQLLAGRAAQTTPALAARAAS
jgi:lyso-ornithine lipid O-acyltransferase